jgi:DNA-binding transcriptional MocR family regulator
MVAQALAVLLPSGSVYLNREKPLAPQIVDDLKTRMLSGQYPQSGPLPTVSALAEFYDVTDQIMSNVLLKLVKERWATKEGYGSYKVAAIIPPPVMTEPPADEPKKSPQETLVIVLYCPTCGMWTRLPTSVIEAIPSAITLACVADKTALDRVQLDPAKEVK